ncbi:MAG: phosphoadenosine phosphosulfate reductase [Planctomycetes bacterium]|nr:phosphoadenosine phosphosulfate reductase [Planctomycetota bacterium]
MVAYGLGVNSTAMLVEFVARGIRPDMILFADTGGEKPETYRYMPVIQKYLKEVQFPSVVTVRYEPKWATYHTLEEQCLATGTLPSLAYGGKSCSLKYKKQPQTKHLLATYPPAEFVEDGKRVVRAIGFDAGEERRTYAGVVKAIGLDASERHRLTWAKPKPGDDERKPSREAWLDEHYFSYWYPLYDWRMDRAACERAILDAGLPVPPKSACYFCPASKKREIVWLREHHPELMDRALAIEKNAKPNLTSVVGLGRSFSWGDFLADLDDTPLFPCGE